MTRAPAQGPDVGTAIRRVSELRRLCLSLRDAYRQPEDARLLEEFERWAAGEPREPSRDALRVGFRTLWRLQQLERLSALAQRVPDSIGDDQVLGMYRLTAAARTAARLRRPELMPEDRLIARDRIE